MPTYTIAEYGESIFHIVNHQYSDETVRFAASELQKYLLKATGAVIPYFADCCPMRGPEIRLGANVRGATQEETDIHSEGFYIRGDGEHITITGKTSRGVLYGVYRFLEIFCNFRCFSKDVEVIDSFDVLKIQLEEIREEIRRNRETVQRTQSQEKTTETTNYTTTNTVTNNVVEQNEEEIQRLINRTVRRQMDTITEKVYGRIEKQLQNERRRRGL